jgi:hypothetical protein
MSRPTCIPLSTIFIAAIFVLRLVHFNVHPSMHFDFCYLSPLGLLANILHGSRGLGSTRRRFEATHSLRDAHSLFRISLECNFVCGKLS